MSLKSLDEYLDDVESRFLYNLPTEELSQVDRLFFQIEQAWWFYEDFLADKYSHLPHFKNLKLFAERIFSHCPLLSKIQYRFNDLFDDFGAYKNQIPVFGCILLDQSMTNIALACSWKGKTWGFPRGKVNEGESAYECAIRETLEETGFDASAHSREEDALIVISGTNVVKLYVATNVPLDFAFAPQTRKEVSKVEFHSLDSLPKSYGVDPFIPKLRRWIAKKRRSSSALKAGPQTTTPSDPSSSSLKIKSRDSSRLQQRRSSPMAGGAGGAVVRSASSSRSRSSARGMSESSEFNERNRDTFREDLSSGTKGWGVQEMFAMNSKLTGRQFQYDGNPHSFGSSHPTYVNYSSLESRDAREAMRITGADASSLESRLGNHDQDHGLSRSRIEGSATGGAMFSSFEFNCSAILGAIDIALRR